MQASLQTALEGAVRRLSPEQAYTLPENLLAAFLRLPVASRRALLAASRLEVWVSMMSYEPATASRYAFCMAGGTLPPTTSPDRLYSLSSQATVETRTKRLQAAEEMLRAAPDRFQSIEDSIGAFILRHSSVNPPSVGRWVLRSRLGEDAMVVLSRSRHFRRVGSSQIQFRQLSCSIHPPTH